MSANRKDVNTFVTEPISKTVSAVTSVPSALARPYAANNRPSGVRRPTTTPVPILASSIRLARAARNGSGDSWALRFEEGTEGRSSKANSDAGQVIRFKELLLMIEAVQL